MKWDGFYRQIGHLEVFDLSLARQILVQPKPQVVQQLHRWKDAGRLIPLRRGLYALSPDLQKRPLSPLAVANELYRPSYLSGLWAMGFYGLIPERVVLFTSVTTRVTRRFRNSLGEYAYASVRGDLFRNFSKREAGGRATWIAEPEKALLDYWYLDPGEWNDSRMEEMRFQGFDLVSQTRLEEYSLGYPGRVRDAVAAWERMAKRQGEEA